MAKPGILTPSRNVIALGRSRSGRISPISVAGLTVEGFDVAGRDP